MKKVFYLIILLSAILIQACKKDKAGSNSSGPPSTGSTLDKIKDSVYLYAAEDYLWNTSLPTYGTFNPRGFTNGNDLLSLTNELNALSQYAINPATNKPYEYSTDAPGVAKYSFIDTGAVTNELNGTNGDFGFAPLYQTTNDLRVKYVYPGSPADLHGIKRGYQITSINGNTNLSYDAPGYGSGTSVNLNYVINAYSNSSTITMTLLKPDQSTMTVTLSTTDYTVNPVLKDTVYTTANGRKVGYIVFNTFTADANADPVLNAAFNKFTTQGITDLVVDLRYNGGGYVATAEYLDNLIVPASKSGTLMYNTYYNADLVAGKDPLLAHQWRKDPTSGKDFNYGQLDYSVAANVVNFAKQGSLNVSRVFFIITQATASASELAMNNLRPGMNVQFIGETSYGKPVGFFDIDINKYEMFTPEFSVQNSAGQGGYYSGFTPGTTDYPGVIAIDDATKEFGDPTENLLSTALNYVQTGTYSVQAPTIQSLPSKSRVLSLQESNKMILSLNKHKFTGMVLKVRKK
jgi:carboxyl-terminal processing protease